MPKDNQFIIIDMGMIKIKLSLNTKISLIIGPKPYLTFILGVLPAALDPVRPLP